MHTQLLDGTGTESVACCDEEVEIILEKIECEFAEVSRFTHTVDTNYRYNIWTWD